MSLPIPVQGSGTFTPIMQTNSLALSVLWLLLCKFCRNICLPQPHLVAMRIEALACWNIHQTHEGTIKRGFFSPSLEGLRKYIQLIYCSLYSKVKEFAVELWLSGQCNGKMVVPACGTFSWETGFLSLRLERVEISCSNRAQKYYRKQSVWCFVSWAKENLAFQISRTEQSIDKCSCSTFPTANALYI